MCNLTNRGAAETVPTDLPHDRLDRTQRKPAAPWVLIACVVIVCGLSVPPGVVFAKAPLGKQWPASQQVSFDEIDHSRFDTLLHTYVDADGYVAYSAWKASRSDRVSLRTYLQELSRADTRRPATKSAQIAFWVNAYNALTVEGILQEYPTSSIRNHTARVFGYNIWEDLPLIVGDGEYSLEAIEHQVLRKMGEPRIHFAIVCASVGCPRLRNEAYTAGRLEQQLVDNARDFFSREKNLQVDVRNQRLRVSAILDWFGSDFGNTPSAQLRAINAYLPRRARHAVSSGNVTVEYLDYDWSLNDQAQKR